MVTASAAAIAFTADFFVDNLRVNCRFIASDAETALVISSSLAGLATAGLSLLNLRLEHRSYQLHLGYR